MKKSKVAYLVIAHGSRDAQANQAFQNFLKRFRRMAQGRKIFGAFLELAEPSIPEALEAACRSGHTEIVIVPMMFFPGRHVKQDIPRLIQETKAQFPEVDFHFASPVAENPLLGKLIKENAAFALRKGKMRGK